MKQKSTIILTGGAGFIGSCVLRTLNDQGYDQIIVVDNLGRSEKWKNLVGKRFLDVLHKDQLFDFLKKERRDFAAIFHLGACSSTVEKDAHYLLENNYKYSVKLAEYALEKNIRFIYASSAATYGDGEKSFSDQHPFLDTYQPLNMYGYSKHLFDLWLKQNKLLEKVVGLKYFNVFGPNEYHKGEMASSIFRMFPEALTKGSMRLFQSSEPEKFEDGGQLRDFIYVKDAACMTVQFLHNQCSGIYNIGMGIPHTWNALAEGLGTALGKKLTIQYIPMPDYLIGKYQNYTCADMSKTAEYSLLKPKFSFKEAIKDYVQNYLISNKYW